MQDKNLINQYAAQNGIKNRRQYQSDDYYDDDYNYDHGYNGDGDYIRPEESEDDYPSEEYTPAHFKQKNTGDPFTSITLTQTAVCIAALLAVFIIKFIGGNIYTSVKTGYINRFCRETSAENVVATITSITNTTSGQSDQTFNEQNPSQATGESSLPGEEPKEDGSYPQKNESRSLDANAEIASSDDEKSADETSDISENATSSDTDQSTTPTAAPLTSSTAQTGAKVLGVGSRISPSNATISAAMANSLLTPISGEITSLYGLRDHPIYNENLFHSGVDIAANYGSEIKAALDGTIKTVSSDSGYGIYTVLQSGNITTLYAHCSKINVSEGDTVKRGQNIAEVGSTGVSTGPHLHFEVSVNGVTVNPLWLL